MAEPSEHSESGQPIYRYEAPKERAVRPAFGDSDNIEAIAAHVAKHIGPPDHVLHELMSDIVHIDVHLIAPAAGRNYYTLVTSGMSELPMTVPEGADDYRYAELVIRLPATWKLDAESFKDEAHYWPIRWLKILARFPHEFGTWLGDGHTIPTADPAEPYAAGTKLCCMMLIPTTLSPESFQTLELPDRVIHFWSLVPLYREEMDYKLKHGSEPLMQRLTRLGGPHKIEVVNVARPNTCGKRFWLF
jgi:hypothetical protein